MAERVRITLQPLGRTLEVERGAPFRDVLFSYGVEFPCGGHGRCIGCRVRVLGGSLPPTDEERRILPASDIAAGWRLACRRSADSDVVLEIAQWEMAILSDESAFEFTPGEGLGIAVDLGTTTLVAQLLDLRTGEVLGVETALNPQVAYGSDIMSRVQMASSGGAEVLQDVIRGGIGKLIAALGVSSEVTNVAIAGNTVMHHLFCGFDVEPLAHAPFEPSELGRTGFRASEIGWNLPGDPGVDFLPCVGGFVGSDILAGVVAVGIDRAEALTGLLDLGTNGEIMFGNRERMVCASTAAGPAFEGGRIGMGMRASAGAIAQIEVKDGRMECRVIGAVEPRGICGSGLVDAVAAALDTGAVLPNGRLRNSGTLPLAGPVVLTQHDIRELQMAKGAIAAGVRIVLERLGADIGDVERIHLAGAFGNYINRASARRIGLLDFPLDKIHPAGNTALLGAKLALFGQDFDGALASLEHISLAAHPRFEEIYVGEMMFP